MGNLEQQNDTLECTKAKAEKQYDNETDIIDKISDGAVGLGKDIEDFGYKIGDWFGETINGKYGENTPDTQEANSETSGLMGDIKGLISSTEDTFVKGWNETYGSISNFFSSSGNNANGAEQLKGLKQSVAKEDKNYGIPQIGEEGYSEKMEGLMTKWLKENPSTISLAEQQARADAIKKWQNTEIAKGGTNPVEINRLLGKGKTVTV